MQLQNIVYLKQSNLKLVGAEKINGKILLLIKKFQIDIFPLRRNTNQCRWNYFSFLSLWKFGWFGIFLKHFYSTLPILRITYKVSWEMQHGQRIQQIQGGYTINELRLTPGTVAV